MSKWLTINPTPLLEECIETFEWDDTVSILSKAREIIGCENLEMVKCWFSLGEGAMEHPLYLICDENFIFSNQAFNSFATLLYIGPYEMTKKELPRYIAGKVILCTAIEGEAMELTAGDIDVVKELYKSIAKEMQEGGN